MNCECRVLWDDDCRVFGSVAVVVLASAALH